MGVVVAMIAARCVVEGLDVTSEPSISKPATFSACRGVGGLSADLGFLNRRHLRPPDSPDGGHRGGDSTWKR